MKPSEKKRFEVKMCLKEDGQIEKAVFIDNVQIDYTIDINSYVEAANMGLQYKLEAQRSIEKHFTQCVSEVLGRYVTLDDIKEAIQTGWI